MQFTVNLAPGELRRMQTRGTQFLIIAATPAAAVAVTLKSGSTELESVRTAGRGFRARVPAPGFDAVELVSGTATSLEIIVTDSDVDLDFVNGAEVTATIAGLPLAVSNDRGTPGNLLHVTGVSLSDAPATAMVNAGPVACGPAAVLVAAADATRKELRILNTGPSDVSIGPIGATWAQRCIVLAAGDVWLENRGAALAWYGITDAGGTANVNRQGLTA